ncbi:DUF922 domain-containing protein [Chelativorans sp. Marseille-P2723]|uniref:DUF922 domain-containing Zn-dependent protease n=1 Tax=Chelativorans sp. Marseille-P2723 TaxID=2709133 RepID=UPI00156DB9AE|nr:DUF922 domain-containing protein [Chelativorans sp. Marseille-P2723]
MKALSRMVIALLCTIPGAACADWMPVEKVVTYAVSGRTGIQLYRSIGVNGPKVANGRAIAYTDFRLTWKRDYQPRDGGCMLASARPNLVITYRLPKVSGTLPAKTRRLWESFIAGVEAHERVHGQIIVDVVRKIQAVSVGLADRDDPDCSKVRAELQRRLVPLVAELKERSRLFDREELSSGGNVHRLVLGLVNGDKASPSVE